MRLQIIVGSVATRAPSSDLASTAFVELGLAIDLFQKGANHSQHSRRARTGTVRAPELAQYPHPHGNYLENSDAAEGKGSAYAFGEQQCHGPSAKFTDAWRARRWRR